MMRWFNAQPIHRKLVVTSMVKTTVVLFAAMVVLLVADVVRFQRTATATAGALAAMMAENIRVALVVQDVQGVADTLEAVRLQASVQRACAYGSQGTLFSQYARNTALACAPTVPSVQSWRVLGAVAPVAHDGATVGRVYVDLAWTTMYARLMTAGVTSFAILVVAAFVMFVVSHRLHRRISDPITQLATAARQMGKAGDYDMPPIAAGTDEVGELVTAFGAMVERVRTAQANLTETNEALRHEVEERRQVELRHQALLVREREANRVKDEFLATVSHELRTPLNAIVGWARILTGPSLDPATVSKAAASLHRNALAQARVIDDLIDISRIVTGKLRVRADVCDLRAVIESAVEGIRPAAENAGIALDARVPGTACIIAGDADRLQQVVWNLLSNAVKFAPGGTVSVSLTAEREQLTLAVEDNGVGIAPEFVGHVFDRFRQADASVTREHGGLGLGLAIAKELVELHGGTITAGSRGRGHGARFTVTFPWENAERPADASEESVPSLEGVSVLVVDDNVDALELLDRGLAQAGARVRLAESGAEALDIWRRDPADVLLCDLAMPRMSGFELLSRIRELDRVAGRVTPAIAVTAHASEEQVARSTQAGFQLHVSKPLDTAKLIRAVFAARARV